MGKFKCISLQSKGSFGEHQSHVWILLLSWFNFISSLLACHTSSPPPSIIFSPDTFKCVFYQSVHEEEEEAYSFGSALVYTVTIV